jgi:hypothetical protein
MSRRLDYGHDFRKRQAALGRRSNASAPRSASREHAARRFGREAIVHALLGHSPVK